MRSRKYMCSNGKVALVTGASQRIGRLIAQALHQSGYNLILHYHRSCEAAEELAQSFNKQRLNSALPLSLDLTCVSLFSDFMAKVINQWHRLDVLIHNASQYYPTVWGQTEEAKWDDLFGTNVKAAYFLSEIAYPFLHATQGGIIAITDANAHQPSCDYSVYRSSKVALEALTISLAKIFDRVRMNALALGSTLYPALKSVRGEAMPIQIKNQTNVDTLIQTILELCEDKDRTGEILSINDFSEYR